MDIVVLNEVITTKRVNLYCFLSYLIDFKSFDGIVISTTYNNSQK